MLKEEAEGVYLYQAADEPESPADPTTLCPVRRASGLLGFLEIFICLSLGF